MNNALNGPGLQRQAEQAVGDPLAELWREREYERQHLAHRVLGTPEPPRPTQPAADEPEQPVRPPDPSQGKGNVSHRLGDPLERQLRFVLGI